MAAQMDIALRRNEDWTRGFSLTTKDGSPIDLTGCEVEMQVRDQLTAAIVATASVEIVSAPEGLFEVLLPGSGALVEYGDSLQRYELPYDLRVTEPDGVRTDIIAGKVIVERGITA